MTVTLQNPSLNQERIRCAVSEKLVDAWKCLLPEFSKYEFGGQLRPTNMVARRSFRAIPDNRANGVVKAWPLPTEGNGTTVDRRVVYTRVLCNTSSLLWPLPTEGNETTVDRREVYMRVFCDTSSLLWPLFTEGNGTTVDRRVVYMRILCNT